MGVMVAEKEKHFGQWLRARVEALGMPKQTAAERIGVEAVTLRSWFQKASPGMRPENKVNLGKLLGMTTEQIEKRLMESRELAAAQKGFDAGVKTGVQIKAKSDQQNAKWAAKDAATAVAEKPDANVEPYSESPVTDIPLFDLELAAGHWTDVSEQGVLLDPRSIDLGIFRVRLRGDSMKPDYSDGDIVEFRCIRADSDGPVIGKDFYVQHADGEATFKRIEAVTEEHLILRALNKKKYPKPMRVERTLVVRMARAIAVVRMIG